LAAQGALQLDEVASPAFTQEGIQNAVGVSRSSASNALKRLERAGILFSDVRHIRGGQRRLRVYTLTERGRALGSDLRANRSGAPDRSGPPPAP
jgi:DNA-binding MarR family transcriptional regulator